MYFSEKNINKFCLQQYIFPEDPIAFIIKINGDRNNTLEQECFEANVSRIKKIYILT